MSAISQNHVSAETFLRVLLCTFTLTPPLRLTRNGSMDSRITVKHWDQRLGWLVITACSFTFVAVVVLHLLQPGLNPLERPISEFALARYGAVMTITFYSQGLGSLALAVILIRVRPAQRRLRIGGTLFVFAAIGAAVAGMFPADPISAHTQTTAGAIHMAAGLLRFLALTFALPILAWTLASLPRFQKVANALKGLAILFVLSFLVSTVVLANINLFGLGQRTFIAILLIWMATTVYPIIRPS